MHINRAQFHAEWRSCGPNHGPLSDAGLTFKFTHDTDARDLRRDLSQQLKPLGAQGKFELGKAGGVGPRSRQALDEPEPTGSMAWAITIGTVRLTCCKTSVVGPTPATITSGLSATRSAASLRRRARLPPLQRVSIRRLR